MKIVLTRSMLPGDIQYIRERLDRTIGDRYEIVVPPEFTEEGICAVCTDADVLLGPYVTPGIIASAKALKLIQVPWTGMDTFDFSAVQGVSAPVCNTHSNADAVAEIGVTILLDLLKKVSYHDRKMRAGSWNRDQQPLNLKSKMLKSQTVCVLGFGNIGSRIGRLIGAFGAEVIAVDDRAQVSEAAQRVYPNARMMEAVAQSDVILCALPLTDETRGLINKAMFDSAKDGAILVNISRAAVVDEDAVWDALTSGKLAGFGADVWWNPPKRGESFSYPSAKHDFHLLDQVLMSPHRAGFIEGSLPHLDGAVENITALFKGEPLSGIVDISKGY